MSTRHVVLALLIVAALLAVGAMFVLPSMSPRGLIVRENSRSSRNSAREAEVDAAGNAEVEKNEGRAKCAPVVIKSGQPETSARAPFDTSALKEGDVLIRASVRLSSPHGIDVFRILGCESDWYLNMRFEATGDEREYYWDGSEDGHVQTVESRDNLPIVSSELKHGKWSASISVGNGGAYVEIKAPTLKERVLDFGTVELDLNTFIAEQTWIVLGRLLHTSGLPIRAYDGTRIRFVSAGNDGEPGYDLELREDGGFGFEINEYNPEARPQLVVGWDENETVKALTPHKITGRIIDFGDIKLDCAALEVRLAAWPEKALRMARRGLGNADELPSMNLHVSLNNFANSSDVHFSEPDTSALMFVHPGPYRWSAHQDEDCLAFAAMSGVIDLLPGKVTQLSLAFEPVNTLLVNFKAPRPQSHVQLSVVYVDEASEDEEHESMTVSEPAVPFAIANAERRLIRLSATSPGFNPVSLDLPADATQCTLEFTAAAEIAGSSLYVVLPALTPELKQRGFCVSLCVTETVNGQLRSRDLMALDHEYEYWGVEEQSKLHCWPVQSGVVCVWLRERHVSMGYPGGIVCGPVEVNVQGDKPAVAKLPAIGAPPWQTFGHKTQLELTCSGQPLTYSGPVCVDGRVQQLTLSHLDTNYRATSEYAIADGEARHAFLVTPPTSENATALYRLDLPARLEIRVRRGKNVITEPASVMAMTQEGNCSCTSWSQSAEGLKLWAPIGKARITVTVQQIESLQRDVDVTSELQVIEFALEGSFLNLVWSQQYSEVDGSPWLIRNAEGEIISVAYSGHNTFKLAPGPYTLAPECKAGPELRVEIKTNEDALLQVPFVPRTNFDGTALLRFPKDLKPNPDGYHFVWRWYVPTGDDPARDILARDYYGTDSYMHTRTDGIKLFGLPVNLEFVLVFSIASYAEDGGLSAAGWACTPRRYTLQNTDMLVLEPEWKPAVVLGPSWEEAWNCTWTGGPGTFGFVYDYEWRVMLPGTYTLKITRENSVELKNLTLTHEPGKLFEMPEDVRAATQDEPGEGKEGGD